MADDMPVTNSSAFSDQYARAREKLLVAVAVTVAASCAPSAAQEATGRKWANETCTVSMSTDPEATFTIKTRDGLYSAQCRIVDWPISSPTATMGCADTSEARMTTSEDGVVTWIGSAALGGSVVFYPEGHQRNRC